MGPRYASQRGAIFFSGPAPALAYLAIMRFLICLLALTGPATAWEFTPGLPCLLTHETPQAEITLTYDPRIPLYTVTIRQNAPLPEAPVFSMRFDGPAGLTISTDRHGLSTDSHAVTVSDRGFGNVLNGLQFNDTATALLGDRAITFPLEGAADPVAAFRLCNPQAGV